MTRPYEGETTAIPTLNRRELLVLMGATAAATLAGCRRGPSGRYTRTTVAGCLVSPAQTEGPYFVDEQLRRSDIRQDPADNSVRPGVPLRVVLTVYSVADNTCTPLPGATVDLWHCDALGTYSAVTDDPGGFGDTRGKKFLRGYQVTDAAGKVEFQTIYPGWYPGRAVHLHHKICTNSTSAVGHDFTSQLYFDEAVTDHIHAQARTPREGDATPPMSGTACTGMAERICCCS